MGKKPIKYIALLFILNLCCPNVFAYQVNKTSGGADIKWFTSNVIYYINPSGGPSDNLSTIQTSMQTWTDVVTSYFTFVYGGTTTNTSCGTNDGANIVCFGPMGLTGTLAENSFWYYTSSGQIIDSDIKFNTNYTWATDGSPSAYDVQNVGTHEFGHSLSLDDLYNAADSEKTMYGYVSAGEIKKRTLDQDDIDGITYLYPAVDAIYNFGFRGATPVTGDWNGDGKAEIGVYYNGTWYIDLNGNGAWDPSVDKTYNFGFTGAIPVTGDWNGNGTTKIGVYSNGTWYIDLNGNGAWDPSVDTTYNFGFTGAIPVTGDWNGDGTTKIGVYYNGTWYIDLNGNGAWDPSVDKTYNFGFTGAIPVTGDWNGDGTTKIGVYYNGTWYIDLNGDGTWDPSVDATYNFGFRGATPVTGDWNGNGTTKIGVYNNGTWYIDLNGNGIWDG